MGKIIMWNLMTLDGYFEGTQKWDLEMHSYVWGDELEQLSNEQLSQCHSLLFGRVTYEGMAAYWGSEQGAAENPATVGYMNSIPKIVFSKTLTTAGWNNTRIVKENIEGEIGILKQSDKDSYLFGSADLLATLTRLNLIDEYRLCIVPVILGKGTPLFKTLPEQVKLQLINARTLKNGGVILRYAFNGNK